MRFQPFNDADKFLQLKNKINEYIKPQEKNDLQRQFKKDVPYWQRLNWQVQSDIWNDIRMNSKYGFQLFHKFLKENKQTVIKANGKGVDIVNQFQKVFSETVDDYGLRGRQNLKSQQLKRALIMNYYAFDKILFERIISSIGGKWYEAQESYSIKDTERFPQLKNKIQQKISYDEKDALQAKFKNDVPYWKSLNWQMQSNIWNDIRMNSKYGFMLFQKFLKENKSIVIKAQSCGFDIVYEFQNMFHNLVDEYGLRRQQTQKSQELKRALIHNVNAFEAILFKRIIQSIEGKRDQESHSQDSSQVLSYHKSKQNQMKNQNNQQSFCKKNKNCLIGIVIFVPILILVILLIYYLLNSKAANLKL